MSFSRSDANFGKRERPAVLPPIVATSTSGGGLSITHALRRLLDDPAAPVRSELVAPITKLARSTHAEFAPEPALLELLNLPDVLEHREDPDLAALDTIPITQVAGLAMAATLPTAAASVNLSRDVRPAIAAMITAALSAPAGKTPPVAPARDALATALTTFREAVFEARSAGDSVLPELAFEVVQRVQVMRRRLLESRWRHRVDCWQLLDEIVTATYWPPDAVMLTRQDKRLREYRFRRWPGIVGGKV